MGYLFFTAAIILVAFMGRALPRLSAYVLGPGILVATFIFGVYLFGSLRHGGSGEGSAGVLVLVFLLGALVLLACFLSYLLITTGRAEIAKQDGRPPRREY